MKENRIGPPVVFPHAEASLSLIENPYVFLGYKPRRLSFTEFQEQEARRKEKHRGYITINAAEKRTFAEAPRSLTENQHVLFGYEAKRVRFKEFQEQDIFVAERERKLAANEGKSGRAHLLEKLPAKIIAKNLLILVAGFVTSNVPASIATGAGYWVGAYFGGMDGFKTMAAAFTVGLLNQITNLINTFKTADLVAKGMCNNGWQIGTHFLTKKISPDRETLRKMVTWLVGGFGIGLGFEAASLYGMLSLRPEDILPAIISKEGVGLLGGTAWMGVNTLLGRKSEEILPKPKSFFELYKAKKN